MSSKVVADISREATTGSQTPRELLIAEPLAEAVEESGQDQSNTVTVVTPRSVYAYHLPCKFKTTIQETNISASAELMC